MRHLDEGTVHAWVDGALDGARAREVELHLAACESCRDAVAGARGLVAASSRILAALDEVPGGVLPGRDGGAGGGSRGGGPSARGAAARWGWAAAAAVGLLAVGAVLLARTGERRVAAVRLAEQRAPVRVPARNAPPASPAPAPGAGASRAAEPLAGAGSPGSAGPAAARAKAAVPRRIAVDSLRGEAGGVVVRTRYAWTQGVVLTLVATPPGVHEARGAAADAMPVRSAPAAGVAGGEVNAIEWTGADGTRYRLSGAASVAELERVRTTLW